MVQRTTEPLALGVAEATRWLSARVSRSCATLRAPGQRTPPFVVYVATTKAYEFSGKSALRSIELEIPMSPVKGSSSSKTRKIAPAKDSAHTNSEIVTTIFARENRVALTKIALSQNTIITRKGAGIELPACVNNCSRICAPSVKAARARDCR